MVMHFAIFAILAEKASFFLRLHRFALPTGGITSTISCTSHFCTLGNLRRKYGITNL